MRILRSKSKWRDQKVQNSISSVIDVRKERVLREELENLLHREELMWAQKAGSDWIIMGDWNTKYFKTVVKQRRARSRIIHLNRSDGTTTEDPVEIENILVNHFKNSYQDSTTVGFDRILASLSTFTHSTTTHLAMLSTQWTNHKWGDWEYSVPIGSSFFNCKSS